MEFYLWIKQKKKNQEKRQRNNFIYKKNMSIIEYLRQFRIEGYALFDFVGAFFLMYMLAPLLSRIFLKIRLIIPRRNRLFLTLPIAVGIHLLVGNITPMTKAVITTNNYTIKIIMIVLIIVGVWNIKIAKKK